MAVLLVSGYAWANFRDLAEGLNRSALTDEAGPDGAVDILLAGVDSRTDARGNPLPDDVLDRLRAGDNEAHLTDTLMLVHIPEDGSGAVAYSFPRDTYVRIPEGHGKHKINSAFGRGKAEAAERLRARGVKSSAEVERRSASAGRKLMLRTVEQLSGVSIDHYAEVNLLGFYEITKAVGGVPVCLKGPVEDELSGASFRAGHQKISGSDALAFVRQRHGLPRGDLDRVVRQQAFLAGLVRSMLDAGVLTDPTKLRRVIESVQASLVLDEEWDVMSFARQLEGLAGGAVRFETIPVENTAYRTPDGTAIKIDPAEVRHEIRTASHGRPLPAVERTEAASPMEERYAAAGESVARDTGRTGSVPNREAAEISEEEATATTGSEEPTDDATTTPTPAPKITADGIPCVN
ncbi:LCP family protein [Parasphingorhabdus pacifica]